MLVQLTRQSDQRQIGKIIIKIVIYTILSLMAVLIVVPFIWMISSSLKESAELFTYPPVWIPKRLAFENYVQVFRIAPFWRYFINSGIVSVSVMLLQMVTSAMAAYAFARLVFPFREKLFLLYLGTMMIPSQVILVPAFLIVSGLGWVNTYQGMIVPHAVLAFGIFLLRQFYMSIPKNLDDAATIDGCGTFGKLFRIYLPLAKPAFMTLALYTFMGEWNRFFWPLVIVNSQKLYTIQIGLRYFMSSEGENLWNVLMAASFVSILPVLLFFLFTQKFYIETIVGTGLKD